jgi:hypothetical protein
MSSSRTAWRRSGGDGVLGCGEADQKGEVAEAIDVWFVEPFWLWKGFVRF